MTFKLIPGALALTLGAILPLAAQEQTAEAPADAPAADPATVKPDSSYALGYRTGGEFGQRYGNFGITPEDLQTDKFVEGFLAGFKGENPAISEEKLGAAMQALGDLLQGREKELATKNLEAGKAFLAENAKKEGIKTTDSGLQYEVLEPGGEETYQTPKEGEPEKQFMVSYRGTLIDGTEFDASPEGETVDRKSVV